MRRHGDRSSAGDSATVEYGSESRVTDSPVLESSSVREALDTQVEELRQQQASDEHDWAVEQYKTLRQESLQSQAVQHSSLQWGLAIAAASIAAGIAIAAKGPVAPSSALVGVELLLFGLAVPAFLLGSCLSWLGEVRRMMRTAIYVRWIEREVAAQAEASALRTGRGVSPYLNWEHALAGHDAAPVKVGGRDWESYVGCAIVFAGGQVATFGIWLTLALSNKVVMLGWAVPRWLLVLYALSAVTFIGTVILLVALRRVNAMAKVLGYDLTAKALVTSVD